MLERAKLYKRAFPDYPPLNVEKNKIYGVWIIGNYYKNDTDYYGAYPHSYLKRIMSLFPEIESTGILHLFSGSLDGKTPGFKFDIRETGNPEIVGDAHLLSTYLKGKKFKLILADPPYSNEDAVHYGTPMVNRNKVVSECSKILEKGGFLVWLDQVFPMFNKDDLELVGTIGLIRSTNHRVRCVFIFRKL